MQEHKETVQCKDDEIEELNNQILWFDEWIRGSGFGRWRFKTVSRAAGVDVPPIIDDIEANCPETDDEDGADEHGDIDDGDPLEGTLHDTPGILEGADASSSI